MSPVWKTKYGSRRVKKRPPTVEEALEAAACLTQDLDQKVDLAAQLIGMPREEVLAVALQAAKLATKRRTISAPLQPGARVTGPRTVIVEYKPQRRVRAG